MKQYPKIPSKIDGGSDAALAKRFWVYDKIDGSNIRAEWSLKRGFWKFGTRKRLIDHTDEVFGRVLDLAKKIEPIFATRFTEKKIKEAICFFEFHGATSFAGKHDLNDKHQLTLIDISLEKEGFMEPDVYEDFVKYSYINSAKLLHIGHVGPVILKGIKNGTLPGMSFEGVVCKAKRPRKWSLPIMYKLKSDAWISKVKTLYNDPRILEDLL